MATPQPAILANLTEHQWYAFHDGTVGLYFMGFCQRAGAAARAHGSDLRDERQLPATC